MVGAVSNPKHTFQFSSKQKFRKGIKLSYLIYYCKTSEKFIHKRIEIRNYKFFSKQKKAKGCLI